MISLPSKPWKKVRIEVVEGRYRIVFVTEIADEAAFLGVIKNVIAPCLGQQDELSPPDWPSRSITLSTADLRTFKRNLVFACIMVVQE